MKLVHRLEAVAISGALRLLRALGPVAASNLGGAVARVVGPLLPVSRVAHANLRVALPELDAAGRRRVVRGMWDNLGRTACELPHVGSLRATATGPGWEMGGEDAVEWLMAHRGALILVSGHIANWEVLPAVAAVHGLPMGSFYRAASNPLVDRIITDLRRAATGVETPMFAKGAVGAKQAYAYLAGGGRLGILMDQKLNDGIEARFFGLPAMTAPATAAMALRFNCPVLPARVMRLGPARFRLICEPPLPHPVTGDRRADTAALTQQVNDRLEAWIRERPAEWLWLHRRWPKGVVELDPERATVSASPSVAP